MHFKQTLALSGQIDTQAKGLCLRIDVWLLADFCGEQQPRRYMSRPC